MVMINYKNDKISSTLFCELPRGQFFMLKKGNSTVYEKVFDVSTMLNALDVSTGKLVHIDNDVEVVKLTAEITVEKEYTDVEDKSDDDGDKLVSDNKSIDIDINNVRSKIDIINPLDYIELFLENFT